MEGGVKMPKRYDLRYGRLNTISKGGMKENFWNYVERVTGKRSLTRFLWQGTALTFLPIFPTVVGSVLRGIAYEAILGGVGSNCFIEKNVEFNIFQWIFLGNRVLIGFGSILDAGSVESEIQLKDNVRISRYCTLRACLEDIYINRQVNIGVYSHIDGHGASKCKNSQCSNKLMEAYSKVI